MGNRKGFLEVLIPPIDQANPLENSCSLTLHTPYTHGMLDQGGGGGCQKAQKQSIIKSLICHSFCTIFDIHSQWHVYIVYNDTPR